jgi:hypothetical protein
MASSGEVSFSHPSLRWHNTGTLFPPATTITWKENAQPTMRFPPRTAAPPLGTNHPFEWCHTHHEGQLARACARHPPIEPGLAPRQSRLTGRWTATAVQPDAQPRHEPMLEMERILMVDFSSTQAQAKELAPPTSRGEAHVEAATTKSLSASPPLTTDKVDRMYYQLAEIHTIAAAQLAECAH